jgi:8-hydroxy-5-deazaflavin:NADPH oxidoreductase
VGVVRVGVIGAGRIGGTAAGLLARAGHDVVLANSRGPETLRDEAERLGVRAGTVDEAAAHGEVVLLAVPLAAVDELPAGALAGAGRVVLDANNYYPGRDGRIDELEGDGAIGSSELLQRRLGADARVVKALNTVYFERLAGEGRPAGTPGRLAAPVAGDDAGAKEKVIGLLDDMGFDGVDAGSLADGRDQQPGTPVYNQPLDAAGVRAALGL